MSMTITKNKSVVCIMCGRQGSLGTYKQSNGKTGYLIYHGVDEHDQYITREISEKTGGTLRKHDRCFLKKVGHRGWARQRLGEVA